MWTVSGPMQTPSDACSAQVKATAAAHFFLERPPTRDWPKPVTPCAQTLLDIFTEELQGVGIYLLLFDAELVGLPFGVMPEQRDAARFIADIRGMSHATAAFAGGRASQSKPAKAQLRDRRARHQSLPTGA